MRKEERYVDCVQRWSSKISAQETMRYKDWLKELRMSNLGN